MSRRIIEIATPIGNIQNTTIEPFLLRGVKIKKEWEPLANKTASQFLDINGWPFDSTTFIWNSLNNEKLDLSTYHETEYSKYGRCHVLKDLPIQKQEGIGLKLLLNIKQSGYSTNELEVAGDHS